LTREIIAWFANNWVSLESRLNLQATPPHLARLREFARDLAFGLGKVSAKFVEDALVGIYLAKSVNLTEVAHALDENIAIHATQKRLSRNLGQPELGRLIAIRLLTFAARRVRQDTLLAVHVRDLKKRYARQMQYLLPLDESATSDASGYRVCEIVACEPGTDRYTPIASHLWSSHAPSFVSDSAEVRIGILTGMFGQWSEYRNRSGAPC
jgi:hypothetical protein